VSVDLRQFRSFLVVAEEGHIGRAAQRLFISQPALSRQMHQLEHEMDALILVRTPTGVELTEAGCELLIRARIALEPAEDALAVGRLESRAARWRWVCRSRAGGSADSVSSRLTCSDIRPWRSGHVRR
jgi:DNA-binding transcriptional LysR family regulator